MITVSSIVLGGVLALGTVAAFFAVRAEAIAKGVCDLRVELWQMHDQLIDDIVAGRFSNLEHAMVLRHMIRTSITHARHHTVLRMFGTYAVLRATNSLSLVEQESIPLAAATRHSKDPLVQAYNSRLSDILAHHVFRITPLSRFGMVLVPLLFALYRLVNSNSRAAKLVDQPERLARGPVLAESSVDLWMDRTSTERPMAAVC